MSPENTTEATAAQEWPTFEFYEYNARRRQRGVEAVRLLVTHEDGATELLWMSEKDVRENIAEFGENPALKKALDIYQGRETS